MRDKDVDNYMLIPRSWEREHEYSCYCSKCDNGIQHGEKFWRLPWRSDVSEILCERCKDYDTVYAKYDGVCCQCGEVIREDDDCFVTEDAKLICLSCLEEDAEADWSVC